MILVFDKGNNSQINIEDVMSKMHVVASVKHNQAEELLNVPFEDYQHLYTNPQGNKIYGYRTKHEFFEQEFTTVVLYNEASYFRSQSSHVDRILFLQRAIGNQAVQRLIKSGTLQAKLQIGQPGDKYEQEADRVADEVMRMPEPGVQRQVEPEEEEEELQAKPTSGHLSEVNPDLESRIHSLEGGGQPLSENDRVFFEPRFGHDFSQVRVHTDTLAAEAARAVNARAFTIKSR